MYVDALARTTKESGQVQTQKKKKKKKKLQSQQF